MQWSEAAYECFIGAPATTRLHRRTGTRLGALQTPDRRLCSSSMGQLLDHISARFVLFWRPGREILSFFILETNVVLFNPSRSAAPPGPPTTQSAACNVCSIKARWKFQNVPCAASAGLSSRLTKTGKSAWLGSRLICIKGCPIKRNWRETGRLHSAYRPLISLIVG